MKPVCKVFADWALGNRASFEVTVTDALVASFAALSGDTNPLHTEKSYAQKQGHKMVVAHGMLGGALFSQLIGMYLPGTYALYLSQTLNFRKPLYPGTDVTVVGEIIQKVDSLQTLKIRTTIAESATGEVLVDGEALVQVLK